tara:strand:- start:406 stop:1278 length:873 start_codon:yes stop_codon:yes gene_type:complete
MKINNQTIKKNPYFLEHPSLISFSGGRTSGFMLKKILEAHENNLPNDVHVVFANTGKEMPQTYDFVKNCELQWNVKIHWLEFDGISEEGYQPTPSSRAWKFKYKITDFENCSRKGEPFEILIDYYKKLPNMTNRFCTYLMKQRAIKWFEKINGLDNPDHILGLRYDEPRRVHRVREREGNQEFRCPLYVAQHTKIDVKNFWDNCSFDLDLIASNGHTILGNCDMCFLKGKKQLMQIMKEKERLSDWWIKQEEKTGKTFKYDISFQQMKNLNNNQYTLFENEESIDCFCHD